MNFIENPIIVQATSARPSGDYTFHRVVLRISVSGLGSTIDFPQSRPVVTPGETLSFNISPTFRAYAAQYSYAPVENGATVNMPVMIANVFSHDEYMRDGVLVSTNERQIGIDVAGNFGRYSDFELYSPYHVDTVTRKPSTGQLVMADTYFVEADISVDVRKSVSHKVDSNDVGRVVQMGSVSSYIIPKTRKCVQLQFVNSRGLVESAHAFPLSGEKLNSNSSTFTRFVHQLTSITSRRVVSKTPSSLEISCSSGYVSLDWAKWWADEFCQSLHHWMLVEGIWIPVHVTISNSTSLIDRSKTEMCHVEFSILPDVDGCLV